VVIYVKKTGTRSSGASTLSSRSTSSTASNEWSDPDWGRWGSASGTTHGSTSQGVGGKTERRETIYTFVSYRDTGNAGDAWMSSSKLFSTHERKVTIINITDAAGNITGETSSTNTSSYSSSSTSSNSYAVGDDGEGNPTSTVMITHSESTSMSGGEQFETSTTWTDSKTYSFYEDETTQRTIQSTVSNVSTFTVTRSHIITSRSTSATTTTQNGSQISTASTSSVTTTSTTETETRLRVSASTKEGTQKWKTQQSFTLKKGEVPVYDTIIECAEREFFGKITVSQGFGKFTELATTASKTTLKPSFTVTSYSARTYVQTFNTSQGEYSIAIPRPTTTDRQFTNKFKSKTITFKQMSWALHSIPNGTVTSSVSIQDGFESSMDSTVITMADYTIDRPNTSTVASTTRSFTFYSIFVISNGSLATARSVAGNIVSTEGTYNFPVIMVSESGETAVSSRSESIRIYTNLFNFDFFHGDPNPVVLVGSTEPPHLGLPMNSTSKGLIIDGMTVSNNELPLVLWGNTRKRAPVQWPTTYLKTRSVSGSVLSHTYQYSDKTLSVTGGSGSDTTSSMGVLGLSETVNSRPYVISNQYNHSNLASNHTLGITKGIVLVADGTSTTEYKIPSSYSVFFSKPFAMLNIPAMTVSSSTGTRHEPVAAHDGILFLETQSVPYMNAFGGEYWWGNDDDWWGDYDQGWGDDP
jgi:hypothetical protein